MEQVNITWVGTDSDTTVTGSVRITDNYDVQIYNGNNWVQVSAVHIDSDIDGHSLVTGYELFGECGYWVAVEYAGSWEYKLRTNTAMEIWNERTFGPRAPWGHDGRYSAANAKYYFKEKGDRDWFVMRWSV